MTKQQLLEMVRRVIKETIEEKKYPIAGEKGYIKVSDLKKGDVLGGSGLEIISMSSGAMTPSGKIDVTVKDPKTGKELTKTYNKSTTVRLKDKTNENAPAPSKPKEKPGPAVAPGKPGEKQKPRRPLGNPSVKPAPKATMSEAEMLAKIVKRFKSKNMNENAEQKYSYVKTHKEENGKIVNILAAYPDLDGSFTKEKINSIPIGKTDLWKIKFYKNKQEATYAINSERQ